MPSAGLEREAYDKEVIRELRLHDVELVCLAGYMRLLSLVLFRRFRRRS
jgi:phosphoribosylglycinamide formyltransferase-1